MKKFLVLMIISILVGQNNLNLFTIDTRPRLLDGNIVQVNIQIDNNSRIAVRQLEGFLSVHGQSREIINEQRVIIVSGIEPVLNDGKSVTKSLNFPYDPVTVRDYSFHISKIKFIGDYRIYAYHPPNKLVRID
ncbi:MAG: hypothetical protein HQ528_10755 [Candidatus Marinimicrobia bacterium]|nr:hypothetical protein [Candidatus Neomarinimicrobiota bacterium]